MRRVAIVIFLTLAFSGLSMAVTHQEAMGSGEMPAVVCLEHCLRTTSAVGGVMAAPAFLAVYLAALGTIGGRRLFQASPMMLQEERDDKLLRKRKLATVVLRN